MSQPEMNIDRPEEPRLDSWKEIAAYLQRNAVTARRWEREEGLPVHRHTHKSRSSVYAYPSEIDAWRAGRKVVAEKAAVPPFWRVPAFALTILLCLIMVGNGIRQVSAQQSDVAQMRQVPIESGTEFPSPDGRYLSYTDWSTGDLAVRDLTTGAKRRLTEDGGWEKTRGYAAESLISPDGRQVAYAFFDPVLDRADLRVVPFTGGDPRNPNVVHHSDETAYLTLDGWTPDSKNVLVTRQLADGSSQIAMISTEDGSLRVLKSFGWRTLAQAALSPDGRYVAYSGAESETDWDIFVLASDGSRQGKLTEGPAVDSSPMWSPDSSQVLFFSDRTGTSQSMWTVPVKDGKASGPARLVKADFGFGTFPRSVTQKGEFYFVTGSGAATNVYCAEFDARMMVAKNPAPVAQRFIGSTVGGSWSPDGEFLAYYALRARSQVIPGGTDLIIRTLKTGTERVVRMPQLTVPPYLYTPPPRWFPDGQSVMVVSYARQRPGLGFYRVDLATGNAELLQTVQAAGPPDLSPDGKAIFYRAGDAATGMRLVRFELDGKREIELKRIPAGKSVTPVVVSPDGKQLAYGVLDDPIGTVPVVGSLEIMAVSGGEGRRVLHGKMGRNALAWSADQRYLVFAFFGSQGTEKGALWRAPVAGGEPEKIGNLDTGVPRQPVFFPQFHPDGRRFVFASNGEGSRQLWVLEHFLPSTKGK